MLDFIGCGAAFNTALGNNSAYIKKDNVLFLIDCGSSTFKRIQELNLLDGVKVVNVFITHTHPDHIGSLGDLIFYTYYSMGDMGVAKVHLFSNQATDLGTILTKMGVLAEQYYLTEFMTLGDGGTLFGFNDENLTVHAFPIPVNHVKELKCVGFLLLYNNTKIYYSGDSNEIPQHILDDFKEGKIHLMYQDTCKADYEGNVHLSLRKLTEAIPLELRHRVYCMHLDKKFDVEEAKALGFNVVYPTPDVYETESVGDINDTE